VNLFDWDSGEVKELEKLTAASESRNTLVDKKYRQIFYLSKELMFALSLPSDCIMKKYVRFDKLLANIIKKGHTT
jgi:hypothetical protein